MLRLDLRHDPLPSSARVVVIGSGPSGMTVAATLAARGIHAVVVESGPDAEQLNRIDNVGAPRVEPQRLVRRRELGGSSMAWSGRCTPLDDIDFEERDWVPHSGWPITPAQLGSDLDAASELFALGEQEYGDGLWPLLGSSPPTPRLDPALLLERFWHFSRGRRDPAGPTRFDGDLDGDFTVVTSATATRIHADSGRATAVDVATPDGAGSTIACDTVVVAGGAIETPRLLLASGLGNELTGRYLMDHPGVAIASIPVTGAESVRSRFGSYWRPAEPFRLSYLNGIALSPRVQREQRLLNAACWLDEFPAVDDPWQAGIRLAQRLRGSSPSGANEESVEFWRTRDGLSTMRPTLLGDVWAVLRHPVLIVRGLARLRRNRPPLYRADRIDLYALAEQLPDPDSRVSLSDRLDPLGVPLPRIDWRLHDEEFRTVRALLDTVIREFERIGLPAPQPAPWMESADTWRTRVLDRAHQLGTARMGATPETGVVDTDLKVYGTENVFVADGSVFPTSGHANPTLLIVALAHRLALHLAARE
ncbi:MAG: GMC family oxidoreductase [Protaetiibacter sp.]